ncbi:MAG: DUF5050 domain-containing protein [Bacillota bacterium]|nr:DUF5050 domain-containing protein [Bacillota bacterium]
MKKSILLFCIFISFNSLLVQGCKSTRTASDYVVSSTPEPFQNNDKAEKAADPSSKPVEKIPDTSTEKQNEPALDDTNKNGFGNTIGNISAYGIAAKSEGWIYYARASGEAGIYKMKPDGTEKSKICSDVAYYINIQQGWLYYRNINDEGRIYRIKLDGSEKQKLNDDNSFYVNLRGDWLYYQNASKGKYLYKMKTDGSERIQLNSHYTSYIAVVDDWVFYQNETNGNVLYKIKTDGTQETRVNNDISVKIIVDDGWVYYTNKSDGQRPYRIQPDGTGRTKLCSDRTFFLNLDGDWLYCADNKSKNFYKIKKDGSEKTLINNDSSWRMDEFNFAGDWIFYEDYSTEVPKLGMMKKDGSSRQMID